MKKKKELHKVANSKCCNCKSKIASEDKIKNLMLGRNINQYVCGYCINVIEVKKYDHFLSSNNQL